MFSHTFSVEIFSFLINCKYVAYLTGSSSVILHILQINLAAYSGTTYISQIVVANEDLKNPFYIVTSKLSSKSTGIFLIVF